ncbi:hypothetical protein SELMODRAFT_447957 [Selaginella moellendorffii]|uniref:Coatomer subunit alpha n=1 Tax=Selaginella moellendorffii TaxID=88036 RepID=D8T3R4_SELML|nr:coatomer subunit alpha-1 [Selaginella moellendorffii]EFJ08647.1 hypothetical protein SELMODRAFT_447957 [Selaginella moellendorffii]|eukprot:XP_002990232.1 coatomer subunit alpha-1 [Selaginella moellendorffii]
MLTTFETKSNRVKGLSFHPKRPWILASLHTGVIHLWDYRMGSLIDRFDEHDGPVRGVHFHSSQPLFVSGGDDYKIKVWNYKARRCLFTLLGHLDYIRTVQFHQEYPWIVSASDDQTIRIWNWQSRTCVSVLTGHNHYVMCASFHVKDDLVVSASLDQTVRVWDISSLRKKTVSPAEDLLMLTQMNSDLFGGGDVVVKYVLEGHDRGVNWAAFHPSLPLIVSGADDRQVKLWRINDTKAWEVDTLRGHTNNVSCVLFHARQDIIVSNSEDKTIRVWDLSKRSAVQTFRRDHDRFWVICGHPEMNLLAAGHDSGIIVFKLERERPAYTISAGVLYYVKEKSLRTYDFATSEDTSLINIRRAGLNQAPRTLSYNPAENAVLLCSDVDNGTYELYIIPRDSIRNDTLEPKKGSGSSAVFVARNRFAVLDKAHGLILVKNLRNEVSKRVEAPSATVDAIFYAGTGTLLCRSDDKMILFDLQQKAVLGEIHSPQVKYVVWSLDMEAVALVSKHSVVMTTKTLALKCSVHETIRIKSAAWDDKGVLFYTTLNHIKYCLPNGDNGTISTLDVPIYITRVAGDKVYFLDREGKVKTITIDTTEFTFKLALLQERYDRVLEMIRSSRLCGQAIISYLQQKGFPEVALHFVKDERTKFNLAIECGNIEVAVASAKEIDEKDYWYRLGVEALRQGNHEIVEYAYQRTRNFERLSFLYLITGNLDKLSRMLKIAETRNDVMGCFHNALYLGDVEERVKLLEKTGHVPLAYATAAVHGLVEVAERLATELGDKVPQIPKLEKSKLLVPPSPILRDSNWPLLLISRGFFEGGFAEPGVVDQEEENAPDEWGEELVIIPGGESQRTGEMEEIEEIQRAGAGAEEGEEEGGWELEDLELPPEVVQSQNATTSSFFAGVTPGAPVTQLWTQRSSLAADHVAAGAFDSAMRLLNRQLGIKNFAPLQLVFCDLHLASQSSLGAFKPVESLTYGLERGWSDSPPPNVRNGPALIYKLSQLEDRAKQAYKLTTEGKFTEALRLFLAILHTVPVIVVDSRKEVDDVKDLIGKSKEYVLALKMELKRKDLRDEPVRQAELAAYFPHCDIQPSHVRLGLQSAMAASYRCGNFATAAQLARRLLDMNPNQASIAKARQLLQACERNPRDEKRMNYDGRNPFVVCGATFTPIYAGSRSVSCPYCAARFVPEVAGRICSVCDLAVVDADASGLVCCPTQSR